jgi:cytochrome c553
MMREWKSILVVSLICAAMVTPDANADGKEKAQVCGACHGTDGNSTTPIWPSLAGQGAPYTSHQLRAFKSRRRDDPAMSSMADTLEETDMDEIAAYYAALPVAVQPIAADKVAAGQRLYRGGDSARGIPACMACHGPNGAGNAAAKYPALRGQQSQYTVIQLKAYRDGKRTTDPQQMMRNIAEKMSNADMEAIAQYISALH